MTTQERKRLAELILAYGDACRKAAIAWSNNDPTASAKKEADELVDYLFEIEVCNE